MTEGGVRCRRCGFDLNRYGVCENQECEDINSEVHERITEQNPVTRALWDVMED